MQFDIMLQSLLNRGAVTDGSAPVDQLLTGAVLNHITCRWEIDIGTLDQLRELAGDATVALRFEPDGSPDPHLLIIEDALDG